MKFQNSIKHHLKRNEKLMCCSRMPRHPAPCNDQHRVAKRAMDVKGCGVVNKEMGIP